LRRAKLQPTKRNSHEFEHKLVGMLVVVALVMVVVVLLPLLVVVVGALIDVVVWVRPSASIFGVKSHSGSHWAISTHHAPPRLNLAVQIS